MPVGGRRVVSLLFFGCTYTFLNLAKSSFDAILVNLKSQSFLNGTNIPASFTPVRPPLRYDDKRRHCRVTTTSGPNQSYSEIKPLSSGNMLERHWSAGCKTLTSVCVRWGGKMDRKNTRMLPLLNRVNPTYMLVLLTMYRIQENIRLRIHFQSSMCIHGT